MQDATQTKPILELATVDGRRVQESETLLTFKVAGETFAIAVETVSEIIDPQRTTRVPNGGPMAPTLINVRGTIVPVVDLRYKLGMKSADRLHTSRMLVIDVEVGAETCKIAIMADEVEDVVDVQTRSLEAVPELGVKWPVECFRGVATRGETLVIVLDPTNAFLTPSKPTLN
jgi:purine-binding chemotaxis protein CheW